MSVLTWFRDKLFGKTYVAPAPVEPQITDAVTTQVTESKPKRSKLRGKFVADNPATPENEAWVGGKAPPKKPRTSKTKK